MDPVKNPFSPGAGTPPPELAGRDDILESARISLARLAAGRHSRSQMMLGLRGVGKTVLLNEIETMAETARVHVAMIEATEDRKFLEKLVPHLRKLILQLDRGAKMKAHVNGARIALRNFASAFKVKIADLELGVTPEPGIADSGDLDTDLTDLLVCLAKAAQSANTGAVLLLDEVQYLKADELSGLIVGLHQVSQKNLPLALFGAGLPQLAALAGDSKSYAERLFDYPSVGPLDKAEAIKALREPVEKAGAKFETAALNRIVKLTQGYPFFLQEWGYQAWNYAPSGGIPASIIPDATKAALARLDRGFFKVRLNRLTPRERDYVSAMAELGDGPHRSGDIAKKLGLTVNAAAPFRTSLIDKGMIYSPAHGETAFSVPMFDAYIRRAILRLGATAPKKPSARKRIG